MFVRGAILPLMVMVVLTADAVSGSFSIKEQ